MSIPEWNDRFMPLLIPPPDVVLRHLAAAAREHERLGEVRRLLRRLLKLSQEAHRKAGGEEGR